MKPSQVFLRATIVIFKFYCFCDKDVARMIARYSGATLGLLAFTIVIAAGLFTHNPFTVTLSRSIFALFMFCMIGFVLGGAAQLVVNESTRQRKQKFREKLRKISAVKDGADLTTEVEVGNTGSVNT